MNAVSRINIAKSTAKVDSESLKLQQELQKKKENTALHMKTIAWPRSTTQSLNTNADSLFSEVEILRKGRNCFEVICDGAKAQEALLAAKNRRLTQ